MCYSIFMEKINRLDQPPIQTLHLGTTTTNQNNKTQKNTMKTLILKE